jgi:hypothetical protein
MFLSSLLGTWQETEHSHFYAYSMVRNTHRFLCCHLYHTSSSAGDMGPFRGAPAPEQLSTAACSEVPSQLNQCQHITSEK